MTFGVLGGFLGVVLIGLVLYRSAAGWMRHITHTTLSSVMEELDTLEDQNPRSLNGCDALLLPQIIKDFPDFDPQQMKAYAETALKKRYGSLPCFIVHNIVISRYLSSGIRKVIVLQAAASYEENGRKRQKRYTLHYEYTLETGDASIAANCPNCGGALGYGVTVCPYCSSRVANVMGNTWAFTEITED